MPPEQCSGAVTSPRAQQQAAPAGSAPPGAGQQQVGSAPQQGAAGARLSGGSGSPGAQPPPPRVTSEERLLLEALDVGPGGSAPVAPRPAGLPVSATMQPARSPQQAPGPVCASADQAAAHAGARPPLAQQHTLPAELGRGLVVLRRSAGSPARSTSSHSSQQPLDLSHAVSLEHALQLAAAVAMAQTGGGLQPRSSDSGSSHPGSITAASRSLPSSAGMVSRASTARADSLGRWDSQTLGLAAGSRHRSGVLPGGGVAGWAVTMPC